MSAIDDFRHEVRQRLGELGMTQAWLAEQLHTSQPYVNDILAGRVCPTLHRCEEIAKVLGLTIRVEKNSAKSA